MSERDLIIYRGPDGVAHAEVRYEGETFWLTQKQMAELFGVDVHTINEHLGNVYAAGELAEGATIRSFRMVRTEGNREVSRPLGPAFPAHHRAVKATLRNFRRVRTHENHAAFRAGGCCGKGKKT
jgi:hypothetical protein